jgi:hypothetical protein
VDVLPAAGGHFWDEPKPHVMEVEIDDVRLKALDFEGLLKTKQGTRPQDPVDAATIRRAIELLKRRRSTLARAGEAI